MSMLALAGCAGVPVCDRAGDPTCEGPIRVQRYERVPVACITKLERAVARANEALCSQAFADAAGGVTDWDHASDCTQALPCFAGRDIVAYLRKPRRVVIRGWNPDEHWWITNRVEAFTHDGVIHVNTRRLPVLTETQWAHVLAHEYAHIAGYTHDGNQCRGNEKTVPYQVGRLVQQVAEGRLRDENELVLAEDN